MNTNVTRSNVEIISQWDKSKFNIRYALFDFDGTISLIREGWQDIMIPYFCELLKETGTSETDEEIRQTVRRFVTDLTGKQTIFQCIRLNEEIEKRGGRQRSPSYIRESICAAWICALRSARKLWLPAPSNLKLGWCPEAGSFSSCCNPTV